MKSALIAWYDFAALFTLQVWILALVYVQLVYLHPLIAATPLIEVLTFFHVVPFTQPTCYQIGSMKGWVYLFRITQQLRPSIKNAGLNY
jgi:hypothetical protein